MKCAFTPHITPRMSSLPLNNIPFTPGRNYPYPEPVQRALIVCVYAARKAPLHIHKLEIARRIIPHIWERFKKKKFNSFHGILSYAHTRGNLERRTFHPCVRASSEWMSCMRRIFSNVYHTPYTSFGERYSPPNRYIFSVLKYSLCQHNLFRNNF